MTFLRLSRADWVAFAAALALLVTMSALDWYSTHQGEECRRIESVQTPNGGAQGDLIGRDVRRDARECAERREKTAWQAPGAIDGLIAFVLVVAIASAGAAACFRAADRRFEPPLTPSAVASAAGLLGALLILYRVLQPPGLNEAAVVKLGAPLGLVLVGVLGIAARIAALGEREAPPADAADETPAAGDGGVEDEQDTPSAGYEPPSAGEPAPSS